MDKFNLCCYAPSHDSQAFFPAGGGAYRHKAWLFNLSESTLLCALIYITHTHDHPFQYKYQIRPLHWINIHIVKYSTKSFKIKFVIMMEFLVIVLFWTLLIYRKFIYRIAISFFRDNVICHAADRFRKFISLISLKRKRINYIRDRKILDIFKV